MMKIPLQGCCVCEWEKGEQTKHMRGKFSHERIFYSQGLEGEGKFTEWSFLIKFTELYGLSASFGEEKIERTEAHVSHRKHYNNKIIKFFIIGYERSMLHMQTLVTTVSELNCCSLTQQ